MNDNKNGGLSPLARGTRSTITSKSAESRFIPAGAGNSFSSSSIAVVLTVYPRWRGELLIRSSYSAPLAGLSPLARGTQHGRPYEIPVARFIPAGAGNSHPSRNNAFIFPVYPRWRGELCWRGNAAGVRIGLSPLARGTRDIRFKLFFGRRFIPAGAGNSSICFISVPATPVYPRWRGELAVNMYALAESPGLSPLARGTLYFPGGYCFQVRFIPAGAGNSCKLCIQSLLESVYPRWRGELQRGDVYNKKLFGLSPLARGTLQPRQRMYQPPRFIPAGAGNS